MTTQPLRLLIICQRNEWRGPTAEWIYGSRSDLAVRVRSVGRRAHAPLTAEDVAWSELILAMEPRHRRHVCRRFDVGARPVHVLHVSAHGLLTELDLVERISVAGDAKVTAALQDRATPLADPPRSHAEQPDESSDRTASPPPERGESPGTP